MWRQFRNILHSVQTYADLSPDLEVRRSVQESLGDRPTLSQTEWFEQLWRPLGVSPETADFAYHHLEIYSGLPLAQVRPDDRLHEDLKWTLVCWFDWEEALCDDFRECFAVDIYDSLGLNLFSTVAELVCFLEQQRQAADSLPGAGV